MQNKLFASLVLATSFTAACADRVIAVPANQLDIERPGTMAVTGTATLEVSPDCADLTMTLSVDALRPADATGAAQAKEKALVDALGKLGVEGPDLKLSYITLEPFYPERAPESRAPVILEYRAAITITATTHDFGKIAPLMEAGAEAGATSMSSAFRRSDLPELKSQVRDMAIVAARAKAEQTAHVLGIHLGRITAVSEVPNGMMWGNAYFPQANVAATAGNGVSLGGALQPLTLDVSISYELAKTT